MRIPVVFAALCLLMPLSETANAQMIDVKSLGPARMVGNKEMKLRLESPSFKEGEEIPVRYTFQGGDIGRGQDISPPLAWTDVPSDTKSFALIVEDPDAPDPAHPEKTFDHWIIFDIPVNVRSLTEGAKQLPANVREGYNGFNQVGYGGPHPPVGRHRYYFKLYALDVSRLDIEKKVIPRKKDVEDAMWGHILAETSLMGTYQLKRASH